jgi:DNA (cytosine-5)-methyltransferase 1
MTMRNAEKPFQGAGEPTHTITSGGAHMHLVAAFLAQHNIDGRRARATPGRPVDAPLSTVLHSGSHQSVVSAGLTVLKGSDRRDADIDAPRRRQQRRVAISQTRAFLQKYYGADQDPSSKSRCTRRPPRTASAWSP